MHLRLSSRLAVLLALLAAHSGLLAWSATRHSPTSCEPGMLAAGLSHWRLERFELYRVNPPLVRMVAAVPLLAYAAKTDWSGFSEAPGARAEFPVGADFVAANGEETVRLTAFARWACIPFSVAGALICHAWGREFYGTHSGLLATALWCFSPTILAHASLATTDVPCAALAAAASYCFWHWINCPSWRGVAVSGTVLGLAELTKMTLVVLYPLWTVLWLTERWWRKTTTPAQKRLRDGVMLCVLFVASLYVVNLGYLFEGSFTRVDKFEFVSDLLVGNTTAGSGNRLADTWLAALPVPLPKDYVLGVDTQRRDFEHTETPSYLRGRFQTEGWWYYYLYALAVKVPLGTWGLVLAAVILRLAGILPGVSGGAGFFLLAPAAVILAFVSSQSGFSQHSRYVIPIFPFLFIWISQVAQTVGLGLWKTSAACSALLGWSVASSLACYPHSLSYFNELAGGPKGGAAHLLGSDLDWGQDLLYLKRWLDDHPGAKPLYLSYTDFFDAKHLGIKGVDAFEQCRSAGGTSPRLLPGWYAIGVNDLRWWGHLSEASEDSHGWPQCALYELGKRAPVARIGYSIYIFHVQGVEVDHRQ